VTDQRIEHDRATAATNATVGLPAKLKPGKYVLRFVVSLTSASQYWIASCAIATGCADTNVSTLSIVGSDCLTVA
jgi:hypothetical protein